MYFFIIIRWDISGECPSLSLSLSLSFRWKLFLSLKISSNIFLHDKQEKVRISVFWGRGEELQNVGVRARGAHVIHVHPDVCTLGIDHHLLIHLLLPIFILAVDSGTMIRNISGPCIISCMHSSSGQCYSLGLYIGLGLMPLRTNGLDPLRLLDSVTQPNVLTQNDLNILQMVWAQAYFVGSTTE